MTDIQKAMLGDKEAQERVAERGELLPCMICGGKAVLTEKRRGLWGHFVSYYVKCKRCGSKTEASYVKERVVETWNNRCTLLTPEQFKRLECEGDDAH